MNWRYGIIHHIDTEIGDEWYSLHEIYDEKIWTVEPVGFVASSDEGAEGVIASLEMALRDAKDGQILDVIDGVLKP